MLCQNSHLYTRDANTGVMGPQNLTAVSEIDFEPCTSSTFKKLCLGTARSSAINKHVSGLQIKNKCCWFT